MIHHHKNLCFHRESSEESEVMKALREDTPSLKNTPQTRTMKYLEESLLPESEDL